MDINRNKLEELIETELKLVDSRLQEKVERITIDFGRRGLLSSGAYQNAIGRAEIGSKLERDKRRLELELEFSETKSPEVKDAPESDKSESKILLADQIHLTKKHLRNMAVKLDAGGIVEYYKLAKCFDSSLTRSKFNQNRKNNERLVDHKIKTLRKYAGKINLKIVKKSVPINGYQLIN